MMDQVKFNRYLLFEIRTMGIFNATKCFFQDIQPERRHSLTIGGIKTFQHFSKDRQYAFPLNLKKF
ncbi:hypothetical protein DRQ18_01335 [bacterium]|nr:MAG: hypothetical protein DRQ18_01335 [bacterium]